MAYATVQQLMDGWRSLTMGEQQTATELLSRASAMLDKRISSAGRDPVTLTDGELAICRAIVCDAVRYSFVSGSFGGSSFLGEGVADTVMTGDMEGGSLMITDTHMRMLGMAGGRAGFMGFDHE